MTYEEAAKLVNDIKAIGILVSNEDLIDRLDTKPYAGERLAVVKRYGKFHVVLAVEPITKNNVSHVRTLVRHLGIEKFLLRRMPHHSDTILFNMHLVEKIFIL